MKNQKKPLKSKPAAKKKAVRNPKLLAPELARSLPKWVMFDHQLIDGIAARVEQLDAELKTMREKLDFVVVQLGLRSVQLDAELKAIREKLDYCVVELGHRDDKEELHPIVAASIKAMEGDGETQ